MNKDVVIGFFCQSILADEPLLQFILRNGNPWIRIGNAGAVQDAHEAIPLAYCGDEDDVKHLANTLELIDQNVQRAFGSHRIGSGDTFTFMRDGSGAHYFAFSKKPLKRWRKISDALKYVEKL